MRLYNTLGRKLQEFKPIKDGEVTLYTCGPTVYDYYHIGNLRNAVFNDTLRRSLEASGLRVRHVMNITDVGHLTSDADEGEDKLEKGAKREGKTVWQVAEHYTEAFKRDMATLNILPPSVDPERDKNKSGKDAYARATDFIFEQIEMVHLMLDKGFAYQTKQAIYFDVTKLESYGKLTGQKLSDKEIGARHEVVTDPDKHHPQDFAVWFFAVGRYEGHAMQWESPWGSGFPGWHLECSAIIHGLLGDPIDIHTGGVDHIGVHHPNEMAQTEAAYSHELANYWVHNEFILVDGAKMAKSKRNTYTLRDVVDRGFHPLALRLLYLQAHYRHELNFTWESLEAAQNALHNLYAWADTAHQASEQMGNIKHLIEVLGNDLATPQILDAISTATNMAPSQKVLKQLDDILGLNLSGRTDVTAEQKKLTADREQARQSKDWSKADQLRRQLSEQGIELDDTPAGPRWRRTSID